MRNVFPSFSSSDSVSGSRTAPSRELLNQATEERKASGAASFPNRERREHTSTQTTTLLAVLHLLPRHPLGKRRVRIESTLNTRRSGNSLFLALGGLERELLVDTVQGGGSESLVARTGGGAPSRGRASGGVGSGGVDSTAGCRVERAIDDGGLALVGQLSGIDVPDLRAKSANELLVVTGENELVGKQGTGGKERTNLMQRKAPVHSLIPTARPPRASRSRKLVAGGR